MSKHMSAEDRWELFLQTISNDDTITVSKVDSEKVTFNQPDVGTIKKLSDLLNNPNLLRQTIIHLVNTGGNDDPSKISEEPAEDIPSFDLKIDSKTSKAVQVLNKIFSKEFIEKEVGLNEDILSKFEESGHLIGNLPIDGTKAKQARDKAKFEMIQCSIPDQDTTIEILKGNLPKIQSESECTEDSYGKKIIKIGGSGQNSIAQFNYGRIMQDAQDSNTNHPPIIAQIDSQSAEINGEFTINKESLLNYIYPIVNGLVCKQEETGCRPIMFEKPSTDSDLAETSSGKDAKVHIIMDTSGSMLGSFDVYKHHFKDIIGQITEQMSEWQIKITTFSFSSYTREFSSTRNNPSDIKKFIDTLEANGGTNLYGTMQDAMNNIASDQYTIILFTDGHDTEKQSTAEVVLQSANEARNSNPQLSMYTMATGNYDEEFFIKMAKQSGFNHIDLSDISQMESFYQYINSISKTKIIYEFIKEQLQSKIQVPKGEIVVSEDIIDETTKIVRNNEVSSLQKETEAASYGLNGFSSKIEYAYDSMLNIMQQACSAVLNDCPSYFPNAHNPGIYDWAVNPHSDPSDAVGLIGSSGSQPLCIAGTNCAGQIDQG